MEENLEKRQFFRLNLLADVIYSKKQPSTKEGLTLTRNISKGGICLIVYEPLSVNDLLELNIFLPDSKNPIRVDGRVKWIREFTIGDPAKGKRFDVGIEYVDISDEDQNKIIKYVFAHASKDIV